jgi:type IV pilus assembly protein PilZ
MLLLDAIHNMKKSALGTINSSESKDAQQWMLTLELVDKSTAAQLFMPFIKGGAVFVETAKDYQLGDSLYIILTVGEKQSKFAINGKVVWVNGPEARNGRPKGVGVQFPRDDSGETAKLAIESFVGQTQASTKKLPTL